MNGKHEDAIFHPRTMFARAGHDSLDVVTFATGVLRTTKMTTYRQLSDVGFVGKRQLALLDVALGDPFQPADHPVSAYINWGRWLARCECGGVEYVDLEQPVFMCCSCWNEADGHAWRIVVLPHSERPAPVTTTALPTTPYPAAPFIVTLGDSREAIEAALLARADPRTRNWNPAQTVTALEIEAADANLAMVTEVAT